MFKLNLGEQIVFQTDIMGSVLEIAEVLQLEEFFKSMDLVSSIFFIYST